MGRVAGHRGRSGEITVKVTGGDAEFWTELSRVWIGGEDDSGGRIYRVERSRGYRNRLVLKLEGVDGATEAAQLRGREAMAPADEAPRLPEGVYYVDRLIGMGVRDKSGRRLGRVRDVLRTGGADLLVVVPATAQGEEADEDEIMIPLAKGIVIDVNAEEGRITVDPPDGLLELNRND